MAISSDTNILDRCAAAVADLVVEAGTDQGGLSKTEFDAYMGSLVGPAKKVAEERLSTYATSHKVEWLAELLKPPIKLGLGAYRNLLTVQLPTIQDFQYGRPVGSSQYAVVNIEGVVRNVRYGFEFDTTRAQQNSENVQASKQAHEAYEERLFVLTDQFKRNIDTIDHLLYGGTEPVRNISKDYTDAFEQINDYYTDAIEYFYDVQNLAATHRNSLRGRQADIRTAIHTQTEAVGPNDIALWRVRALADLRVVHGAKPSFEICSGYTRASPDKKYAISAA